MRMHVFFSFYLMCLSKLSLQHFEQPLDFCLSANLCNHTSIPVCGKEKKELNVRLFKDQCDLIEYNCDYKKEYIETSVEECQIKNKKQTIPVTSTTDPTVKTSIFKDRSNIKSNNSDKFTNFESSSMRNVLSTIESKTNSVNVIHKNETKGKCTCHLITTSDVKVTKANTKKTTITSTKHVTSGEENTSKTSHNIEVTSQSSVYVTDATTQQYNQTASNKSCTRKKGTTESPDLILSTKLTTETTNISATTSSSTKMVTTKPTENTSTKQSSEDTIKQNTTRPINNNLTNSTNTYESVLYSTTNKAPRVSTQPPFVIKRYPKDCMRPSSWETTAKGETRDFHQILRARYGDRMKILKGTTKWPRRVNLYKRVRYDFFRDRHNES